MDVSVVIQWLGVQVHSFALKECGMYAVVMNLWRAVDARAFWLAWTCIRPVDVSASVESQESHTSPPQHSSAGVIPVYVQVELNHTIPRHLRLLLCLCLLGGSHAYVS